MTPLQVLLFSFAFAFVSFALIGWWYYMPSLRAMPREEALRRLVMIHTTRCAGLAFIMPGVVGTVLDPRFANHAAYGDLLAAILALIALVALRLRWRAAIALVWLFNLEGALDIVNGLPRSVIFNPEANFGGAWYIPIFAAPLLLVTHLMMFELLLRKRQAPDSAD